MAMPDKFILTSLSFLLILFTFVGFSILSESALITSLPGFNDSFPSKHYSGYVTLEENPTQNLFYYFIESERNPSEDPLVLWLNGGPGCSSMDGFIYEHGPFNFRQGKTHRELPTLHLNQYSWSKVSNIIYLDSPVGVGFSYTPNTETYKSSDSQTASHTHQFLLKWFEEFPEFNSNPFYITGESYAGIYVPTLASEIVKGANIDAKVKINLKGYMIGNGATGSSFDVNAHVPFAHGMGLISDEIYEEVKVACKGSYHYSSNKICNKMLEKISKSVYDLNFYNILAPCFHSSEKESEENKNGDENIPFKIGHTKPISVITRTFERDGAAFSWANSFSNFGVLCYNDRVASKWLNDVNVRHAIHAAPEMEIGRWELCSGRINYDHDAGTMIPYHKNLTSQGFRVLIYSGDHDMAVPFTGTQAWTRSLGYKIIDDWRPWFTSHNQVAGFVQGYSNNFTFLTIKGAGHTVPEYKPREAFDFYSRWLEGRPL